MDPLAAASHSFYFSRKAAAYLGRVAQGLWAVLMELFLFLAFFQTRSTWRRRRSWRWSWQPCAPPMRISGGTSKSSTRPWTMLKPRSSNWKRRWGMGIIPLLTGWQCLVVRAFSIHILHLFWPWCGRSFCSYALSLPQGKQTHSYTTPSQTSKQRRAQPQILPERSLQHVTRTIIKLDWVGGWGIGRT